MKCWIPESVSEYGVRVQATKEGRTVYFGRVFPLCVEKHSELPKDQRKYKGRVAFEGSFVSDQNANVAVFE